MSRLHYYREFNLRMWHHYLRMPPYAFDDILNKIKDNAVFHNNSNNAQMDVDRQLAIWLYRAGRYGPGAVVDEIAETTGVSIGSVYNCSRRCIVALLCLHDEAIQFDEQEHAEASKQRAEALSGTQVWRHGNRATDGTPIPLFAKPGWFGQQFYGKDKIYAIQLMVTSQPDAHVILLTFSQGCHLHLVTAHS
ncbi:hypothetical protein DAEQUDRAFT_674563 [Daedalea quercina L-15889]|uniref:DDE Tnp4 domain-containing protein n=1 Tax=Daedalea quercina L-15889 TaxID=1314783 RepID=A0A165N944_9APHY|nr:hypothetical protein DAEQUDRAFT_674563 [Daedalea quercina L-15889]